MFLFIFSLSPPPHPPYCFNIWGVNVILLFRSSHPFCFYSNAQFDIMFIHAITEHSHLTVQWHVFIYYWSSWQLNVPVRGKSMS